MSGSELGRELDQQPDLGSRSDNRRTEGRVIGGRYRLESRLGGGASAEVFEAVDLKLGRPVAVKQLRPHLWEDDRFVKLFRSEAHLAAQLDHPNILTIFDWSAEDPVGGGGAYIVTELLTGGTLRDVLRADGPLSIEQAAFVGLQISQGLESAHARGLVHRDIKPANLLFGRDGRVRIGDFGIARAVAEAAWTEPEGVLIGTARYAAPEQAGTGVVNGLADVYSLAVCLIEAVTGTVPLLGDNAVGTMVLRARQDLPIDPTLGVLGEPVAWAGMADPAERAGAAEMRGALLTVCRSLSEPDAIPFLNRTESGSFVGHRRSDRPRPNVRFDPDGDLVIEGEGSSDLALAADGSIRSTGSTEAVGEPAVGTDRTTNDWQSGTDIDRSGWGDPDDAADLGRGEKAAAVDQGEPALDGIGTGGGLGNGRGRSRARRWPYLVAVLVVIGVGAGAAAWSATAEQRAPTEQIEVALPSFEVDDFGPVGVEQIRATAEANSWTLLITERYEDGTEAGDVLSQEPTPGTLLGYGGTVEVVVSLGPVQRVVPELVGGTETDVRNALREARFEVGSVERVFDEGIPTGTVMEAVIDGADAVPGTRFATGTVVDLVVSDGPAPRTVPSVVGLTVDEARSELAAEQLEVAVVEAHSQTVAEGLIVAADPVAGASAVRGSTVTVTVSLGLPFVVVPDVGGRSIPEAIEELRSAGFTVIVQGDAGASVLATRPQGNQSVRQGSTVEIISTER